MRDPNYLPYHQQAFSKLERVAWAFRDTVFEDFWARLVMQKFHNQ